MDLKLGIIYSGNRIVNHRSLLKIFLNPIFRFLGFQIATPCNEDKTEMGFLTLTKCKRTKNIDFKKSFNYNRRGIKIIKERRFI